MSLVSGTKLGTYEIVEPLGTGGMGEVYRARDSKLKREVAIKVLPESFPCDAERIARFQREAEVLASHYDAAGGAPGRFESPRFPTCWRCRAVACAISLILDYPAIRFTASIRESIWSIVFTPLEN